MILVNGRQQSDLAVADRAVAYGDGLFETIAVVDSAPSLWEAHMERLRRGCARLLLPCPDPSLLELEAAQLTAEAGDAVLKLIVTAGAGGRGYRRGNLEPTRIFIRSALPAHPARSWSDGVTVRWCDVRLARQPLLAGIKHLNRLEQVLARAEWDDTAIAEGLLLDQDGWVVEGTMSNLFVVRDGELMTPPLQSAGVQGIMRDYVLATATRLGLPARVSELRPGEVAAADEVFLTNSIIGIWPVSRIGSQRLPVGSLTQRLLRDLMQARVVPAWFEDGCAQHD